MWSTKPVSYTHLVGCKLCQGIDTLCDKLTLRIDILDLSCNGLDGRHTGIEKMCIRDRSARSTIIFAVAGMVCIIICLVCACTLAKVISKKVPCF